MQSMVTTRLGIMFIEMHDLISGMLPFQVNYFANQKASLCILYIFFPLSQSI